MTLENPPSIPHAHQQIRLGDLQASSHKWPKAIEHYLCAIDYFKAVQNSLNDNNLKSIIEPQIIQCEKTIDLCRLKDRSDQAAKLQAERLSKMTRANSTSKLKPSTKPTRTMPRHNTLQLDNTFILTGHEVGVDSLAALMFPKKSNSNESSPKQTPINARKNKKNEAHRLEELKMSYDAIKTHLKEAMDDIERLKQENNVLRMQRKENAIDEHTESKSLTSSDADDSETELEATL